MFLIWYTSFAVLLHSFESIPIFKKRLINVYLNGIWQFSGYFKGNAFLCHIERVGAGQTRPPARLLSGICADVHNGTRLPEVRRGMGNTNTLKNTKYLWIACLVLNMQRVGRNPFSDFRVHLVNINSLYYTALSKHVVCGIKFQGQWKLNGSI